MSSQPPAPPPNDADSPAEDWALPGDTTGSWEGDSPRPAGAPAAAPAPSVADTLKEPLVALWADPRSRPLVLLSGAGVIGVCALACFVLALAALTNRPPDTPLPFGLPARSFAADAPTDTLAVPAAFAGGVTTSR